MEPEVNRGPLRYANHPDVDFFYNPPVVSQVSIVNAGPVSISVTSASCLLPQLHAPCTVDGVGSQA